MKEGTGGRDARVPACAGTTGVRPVCAPLSRMLDSSLRWNDGDRGARNDEGLRT